MALDPKFQEFFEADPQKALELLQRLSKKVVVPHPAQQEVIDSPARFKLLDAGRRTGKTVLGAKMLIDQTRKEPDRVNWWIAPTYRVVKRGYNEVLRQLPREYLTEAPPPDTRFDAGAPVVLKFKNGSKIEFYSAERPEGMLGEGVSFVVMDEAATMPARVWEQVVRPTLADKLGGALLISTPRGRNWFYDRFLYGQDPQNTEWQSWVFPSNSNPHLPESEFEAMRMELPETMFEQEVLGKFLAVGSNVFQWEGLRVIQKAGVDEKGMVKGVSPAGQVFLGIDLAKQNDYTVLYGARESDGRNVYFERYNSVKWSENRRRIRRAVGKLLRAGAENVTLVMDSTGVGDPIVEEMQDQGFDVVGVNFTGTKQKMVTLLAKDLETGRAFLLNESLSEFENYEMKITAAGRITYQAPEGQHDDVVSAKMLSHWGIQMHGSPHVESLSASGELAEDVAPWNMPEDREEYLDEDGGYEDLLDDDWDVEPQVVQPRTMHDVLVHGW